MPPPPTPHDALFKRIFSDPRNAEDEIRALLPPAAAAALDLGSLRLEPGSFVDEELRSGHTDLLFSATMRGRPVLVYVLLEHQSRGDRWMPLRLVRYQVKIWEAHLRAHGGETLPLVIPIVVQHDPAGWRAPLDVGELIDLGDDELAKAALAPFVPRFRYLVDDLATTDPRVLSARVMTTIAKLALMALRDVRDGGLDLEELVARWAELLRAVREPTELSAMDTIFRYILAVHPRTHVDDVAATFGAISADLSEQVMSTARQLIEQGIEQGIERGIERGREQGFEQGVETTRRATLLRLLGKRFGELPSEVRARIAAASAEELDRWTDGLLDATSLEDLFGET